MKDSKVIIFVFLLAMVPILLGGCNGNAAKMALLTLDITPGVIAINTATDVTYALHELGGAGVTLNYLGFEDYDPANNLLYTYELHESYAQAKLQSILGGYYIPGNATLSGTVMEIYTWEGRRTYTFKGLDDNGRTVEASAELLRES